ncbi:MAG: hypothetical protein UZ05_CHB002000279 [Chlorobi bacterium OLB5]|nr:MAG: hypothetical protein UZ05_CHB002000279 [Chlorobi bacterium OLB5]
MELFDNNKYSGAEFSEDRKYRYKLWRIWDESKNKVQFIGLNPSSANETEPDNTLTRCINFAKSWGFGGMFMTNLFAYVSTDPKKLITSDEDLFKNNRVLLEVSVECEMTVFCWGCFKEAKLRAKDIIELFDEPFCIRKTKSGNPEHPLYLPGNLKPIRYKNNVNH